MNILLFKKPIMRLKQKILIKWVFSCHPNYSLGHIVDYEVET
jgi:hypothetical protein